MAKIPKEKIKDSKDKKEKKFKQMKHKHGDNPNGLEMVDCNRCKFEEREQSWEKHKKDSPLTTKVNGVTKNLQSCKVIRGKYDDVIGWSTQWQ